MADFRGTNRAATERVELLGGRNEQNRQTRDAVPAALGSMQLTITRECESWGRRGAIATDAAHRAVPEYGMLRRRCGWWWRGRFYVRHAGRVGRASGDQNPIGARSLDFDQFNT